MNIKQKLLETGGSIAAKAKINSPKLWTGAVIFGVAATAFLTGMATTKAIKKIEEEDKERKEDAHTRAFNESNLLGKDYDEVYNDIYTPLTIWDKIKIGWPYYIPPFLMGVATIASSAEMYKDTDGRIKKLGKELRLKETAARIYQEEVIKQIGEKKEKKIQHAVHEKEIKEKLIPQINETTAKRCGAENGEILVFEPHTGQYFVSTIEHVKRCAQKVINELHHDEFYDLQLFINEMGGNQSSLTYRKAIQSAGMDHDAIEMDYFIEMHIEEYMGHEVSAGYLNFDVVDLDNY